MGKQIKFGVLTLPTISYEELVEQWKHIEQLGFDYIWLPDHFVSYRRPEQPWFECWTLLTSLAAETNSIRIGTLVTSIPLRHPAMVARQALTVDHISNGRLELGLGTGVSGSQGEAVYSMIGIDDWNPAERTDRFQEIVEIIDQGLRKRRSSYEGNYYHIKEMTMYPEPVQKPRPPITVAALSSKMLKIAVRYADNWNTFGSLGRHSSDQLFDKVKKQTEQINKYCKELGCEPESLVRSILCYGADAFTLYDSTENFREFVEKYREIGLSEFYFYYPFRKEQMPIFEKIAKEILPEIQKK